MSNSKIQDGLVPVKVTRSDGVQTTVYKRVDDNDVSDKSISRSLSERSVLRDEDEFNPKNMSVKTVSEAEELTNQLQEQPERFYEPETQSKIADAMTLLDARYQAEKDYKEQLKQEVMGFFTERQIERGEMKSDDKGRYWIEVADEQTRFSVERAGLTPTEAAKCSESRLDHNLIREQFPETWEQIGKCNGSAYSKVEGRAAAHDHYRGQFLERAEKARERKLGKRPTQSEVISEFMRSVDRTDRAESDRDALRRATADAAIPKEERMKLKDLPGSAAQNYMDTNYGGSNFKNPKTGTSFSVRANMSYDTGSFYENRYEHYEDMLSQRRPDYDERKLERMSKSRANRDWSQVCTMKIMADKVKANYPEKYEKGRTTREMYINE